MTELVDSPLPLPPALIAELRAAYATPPRAYHSFSHVEEVLRQFASVAAGPGWRRPVEVYLAILYHDAIYAAGRRDNEERSAELASAAIERFLPDAGIDAARVASLIRLTAKHGRLLAGEVDDEAALFLDCDMAILAAEPAVFDAYHRAIAIEYRGKLPGWLFEFNRRRFLKGLLARERIFLSDFFHARLDAAARSNLQRALQAPRSALRAGAGR